MKSWSERPIEIRNLFNPAFCGLVLFRALSGFEEEAKEGMPFSLSLLILPLCLQRQSRETLQRGNRGYFLKVVAEHPELQVGFDRRCTDILPFTFEALGLLMHVDALAVQPDGRLLSKPKGVRKTINGTPESIACQRVAAFLGKEFARIGDRGTIYTTLGIRP
ncbi:hypothetical protein EN904_26915 [Mesorhizobium sp. M7A.F.Ca.CA.001.07.2.1]|uniref:three component ABC system middle component n=1 Tax=Mesorhizobium TaxID=68287 RepID=UPI000FCAC7BA|nr:MULTISPECIES: three component ABC system middle component [Mesorhizobium]RVB25389.1 hypothetical protein EN918_26960 [Mesorhizobium sp. M7A.F.Ca.CA.004.05.1.1]MCF6122066.1 DUF6521 family protein [Mesorhizobium ciceri]MCQ8812647.1 DUF6521 family protein [Mesorhizobium sp. SEMIA396]RUX78924.1 hypothetical protein EN983_14355 [Mesorhizobium sp. M7A.F.Ca.CA.004.08.2.1]RUX83294.1 hypothetical protein EN982_27850 [Mesorhizobium sp. M7A.F.Ca.CA.004.08.1.1]